MLGNTNIQLDIPVQVEYVSLARILISDLAQNRREIDTQKVNDLKLAISEACTNAIEAHQAIQSEEKIKIVWSEQPDYFEISIRDFGKGFDIETLPQHPPVTDPERLNFERGLGIPLIKALIDEVSFDSSSEGTFVKMIIFCQPLDKNLDFDSSL